jgi:hypothetical protein
VLLGLEMHNRTSLSSCSLFGCAASGAAGWLGVAAGPAGASGARGKVADVGLGGSVCCDCWLADRAGEACCFHEGCDSGPGDAFCQAMSARALKLLS